jgi:hypothetical protein
VYVVVVCVCMKTYERGLDPVWRCPIGGDGQPEREGVGGIG